MLKANLVDCSQVMVYNIITKAREVIPMDLGENSEKLKKKHYLIVLYLVIGLLFVFLIVLGLFFRSYLTAIIGAIFIISFGLGFLIVKAVRKYRKCI